jgi:zinc and cadmium transporter
VRPLVTAVALTLVGSLGGVLVASAVLLFSDRRRLRLIPWLISYAVGTLLGIALLVLLPEALNRTSSERVLGALLGGILIFFVLEKLVLWRHCHTHDCEAHGVAAPLILIGDAFHNFLDGVAIGTAVLTSVPLGVGTALAVATHEIPQEVGDFAILLDAGYTRRKALVFNIVSGLSAVLGAALAVLTIDWLPGLSPYILSFSAAGFLYIAMADLIPDLHRGRIDARTFRELLLVAGGVATVLVLKGVVE